MFISRDVYEQVQHALWSSVEALICLGLSGRNGDSQSDVMNKDGHCENRIDLDLLQRAREMLNANTSLTRPQPSQHSGQGICSAFEN